MTDRFFSETGWRPARLRRTGGIMLPALRVPVGTTAKDGTLVSALNAGCYCITLRSESHAGQLPPGLRIA